MPGIQGKEETLLTYEIVTMLFKVNHILYCYRLYAEHNDFTFRLYYLRIRENKLII